MSTNTAGIEKAIRRQLNLHRARVIILVVMVFMAPVLAHTALGFGMNSSVWYTESITQSIGNGTLWVTPAHALFQNNMLFASPEDFPSPFTLPIVILLSLIVAGLFIGIAVVIFSIVQLLFNNKMVREGSSTSMLHALFGQTRRYTKARFAQQLVTTTIVGKSTIIAVSGASGLPDMYIDSRQNNLAQREGMTLEPPKENEVVLDGTTYELFKLYAPAKDHPLIAQLFTPDILATLDKELSLCELIIENNTLYAITSLNNTMIPKQYNQLIESLRDFEQKITSAAQNLQIKPSEDKLPFTKKRFIPLLFNRHISLQKHYVLWSVVLIPVIILCIVQPSWVTVSDLMYMTTVFSIALLLSRWAAHQHGSYLEERAK